MRSPSGAARCRQRRSDNDKLSLERAAAFRSVTTVSYEAQGPGHGLKTLGIWGMSIRIDDQSGFRGLDLAQLDGTVLALDWVLGKTHHIWGSAA
jgi:hypothetical protein